MRIEKCWKPTMTFNWGTAIAAFYTSFAIATMSFVGFAMGRSVDLVSPDYYAQSLRQDERMAAIRNAQSLQPAAAVMQAEGRMAIVSLPASHVGSASGTITLYRASDARADRVQPLALEPDGRQTIPLDGLAAGRWTVKLAWSTDGLDYYLEAPLVVR